MANTKQAIKRNKQSEQRSLHLSRLRSTMRTAVKKVIKAISACNQELATECYKKAVPLLDKMATKKVIHKNKAARHKSRLLIKIRNLTKSSTV